MTTPQEAITAESILEKRLSEIRIGETKSEFELRNVSITSDLGKEIISQVAHLYAQQYSIQQNKSEVRGVLSELDSWVQKEIERCSISEYGNIRHTTLTNVKHKILELSSNPIAVEGEELLEKFTEEQVYDAIREGRKNTHIPIKEIIHKIPK